MSFQQRTLIALALCAIIFVAFDWLMPKPELPPESDTIVVDGKGEPSTTDTKAVPKPAVDEPVDDEPTAVGNVAPIERELRNQLIAVKLSNRSPARGGILAGLELLAPQFQGQLTGTDALRLAGSPTLEVSFADEASDVKLPKTTSFELRDEGPRHVTFGHRDGEVEVLQRFELGDNYEARLVVTVTNRGKVPQDHRVHLSTRVGVVDSRYDIARGLCRTADGLEYEDAGDVEDGPIHYSGPVSWGGVDNKYFGLFLIAAQPASDCEIRMAEGGGFVVNRISGAVATLDPGASTTYEYGVYLGAKELEHLQKFRAVTVAGLDLEQAIDWGVFGGVSEWLGRLLLGMLRWFYALTHSWGISIVLLTVVVKLVTLPLTLKQMSSMKRMRAIQPEMAKIKEKYSDDRVKQGQEMQALFARSGVNPLAGCLPTLVQLPIWFALYSMLSAAVELVHQKFLWLPDLTQQDPYYILPLALGVLMVVQNRMMPNTMDEAQAKMMRWLMPIMFTLFMLFLPSGLAVYIFANIFLSIVQTAIQVGVTGKPEAPGKPA
ncbi:MAG: membrane protein insertase YidC [Deltaproteobacteria bacterium]|nr:membrane protein insertase YidC [Nannocystaceae bacterium]